MKNKSDKITLRKFGVTMSAAFLVITLLLAAKHRSINPVTSIISAVFIALAVLIPQVLRPVYAGWMRFAELLGWFNTRLILAVIFYLVFTPIGLILRLLGKDLLERKIDKNKATYWHKIDSPKPTYERQF